MRVGLGIDTHQLISGNSIRLSGIDIPSTISIKAHSDGDIIYHSIADAILGAVGAGDIGDYFPDSDSANKDLDSRIIVELSVKKALDAGFVLNNLDIALLLEKPKISNYKNQMKMNICDIFNKISSDKYVDDGMINIKATTSESLGYIGRGEGVTCYCIASLSTI
ncbi:MAG: 2-C-methyl-D-erythritol 2,4-cyclodiphosphate synthase [Gammaproteobacteria bacterium]|jgi:2-C-methyl-D-erythritol 2,4-cyclodiphosphate synthase